MPTVGNLVFTFPNAVPAQIYDTWQHYALVWNVANGRKAVDVVAVDGRVPPITAWLIEAKDFRIITNPPNPSNIGGLPQLVADKVNDTLAGLADAAVNAIVPSERGHAVLAVSALSRRIVLHLEPHVGPHTALFPTGFSASVLQRLKQIVNLIDPSPLVLNIANTNAAGVPWTVA